MMVVLRKFTIFAFRFTNRLKLCDYEADEVLEHNIVSCVGNAADGGLCWR